MKVATTALISIDIMVNPLGADASLSSLVQVAIDLLWAPVLTDHFFNHSPFSIQNTGVGNLGLFWSVSTQTFVAMKLPENRQFVDTNLLRYGALRQTSFMQGINLVTITLGKTVTDRGIAASRRIQSVKFHWRVDSAL